MDDLVPNKSFTNSFAGINETDVSPESSIKQNGIVETAGSAERRGRVNEKTLHSIE